MRDTKHANMRLMNHKKTWKLPVGMPILSIEREALCATFLQYLTLKSCTWLTGATAMDIYS